MGSLAIQSSAESSLASLPASLPVGRLPESSDLESIAASVVSALHVLKTSNFTEDALWRDTFALTGTMRTFYSASSIATAWQSVLKNRDPVDFEVVPNSCKITYSGEDSSWLDVQFRFRTTATPRTTCSGFLSLVLDPKSGWKIWVLRTIMEQLEGSPNVDVLEPQTQLANSDVGETIDKTQITNGSDQPHQFDCVVVGAGQAGLSTGGRLKALGISYLVIDRMARLGDCWRLRYDSVRLHTPREYTHLPFERTFTPDYQEFLVKDELADAHERWAKKYRIDVWLSTELRSGTWNQTTKQWTLAVVREGKEQILRASHVVLAVGANCQIPIMPDYPNKEDFRGTVLHSVDYKSSSQWKGKAGIVVGSANTAHDVAADMVDAGLSSITMIQRSRTFVLPTEYYCDAAAKVYNSRVPTELADRLQFSNPLAVSRLISNRFLHEKARQQPERFDALERVGFKVQRYGDIQYHINVRLGGHYMDVGTSAKIAQGLIKVKSDAAPLHYVKDGLKFTDGTEVKADVIVFTTGFGSNIRDVVGSIFGKDVQDKSDDFFGIDAEGEIRGAFKQSGHPGLWYIGGAVGHARYWSRFIALQIKADVLGTPLKVYSGTPKSKVLD